MVYHALGIMSGSSLDGLDIAYCIIEEIGGKWTYSITKSKCVSFSNDWKIILQNVAELNAKDLIITDRKFGKYIGKQINIFITENNLEHKIHIIGSHGHTVFHEPQLGMTLQIGDGASIAASTGLAVVSDLRNMDVALGGQGAPIVPIGEKLFWNEYDCFLNIGGIANISFTKNENRIAYDICSANKVLNLLMQTICKEYDSKGETARQGSLNLELLQELNSLEFYKQDYPKSLKNEFGSELVLSIINKFSIALEDKLNTYCHHIAQQIALQFEKYLNDAMLRKMLVTGGGAYNDFLIELIRTELQKQNVQLIVPEPNLIENKEALIMALIAVLRWREEENVLSSVTGASKNSVGGALWMGQG